MAAELSKAYPMDSKITEVAGAPAAATNAPAKFEIPSVMKGGKNKKNKKNSKKRKYHGGNNMVEMKNQEQKDKNVDMKNTDDMAGGNNDDMKNQNNVDMKNQNNVDMKNQNNVDMKNNESKSFFSDWFGGKSKKRKGKKDKKKRKSARKH